MNIRKSAQQGVMLLESLMGLLVFSFGILALVGMQANAIRNTTETKIRSDASFLASQLSAQIWADKANYSDYVYSGSGGVPSKLTNWSEQLKTNLPGVGTPGSSFNAGMAPVIQNTATVGTTNELTITMHWKLPGSSNIRTYRTVILVNN